MTFRELSGGQQHADKMLCLLSITHSGLPEVWFRVEGITVREMRKLRQGIGQGIGVFLSLDCILLYLDRPCTISRQRHIGLSSLPETVSFPPRSPLCRRNRIGSSDSWGIGMEIAEGSHPRELIAAI